MLVAGGSICVVYGIMEWNLDNMHLAIKAEEVMALMNVPTQV